MDEDQEIIKWEMKPGNQVSGQLTNFFLQLNQAKFHNTETIDNLVDSFASGGEVLVTDQSSLTDGFEHSVGRTLLRKLNTLEIAASEYESLVEATAEQIQNLKERDTELVSLLKDKTAELEKSQKSLKALSEFSAESLAKSAREYSSLESDFSRTKTDLSLQREENDKLIKKILWDKKKYQFIAIGGVTSVGLGLLAISKLNMIKRIQATNNAVSNTTCQPSCNATNCILEENILHKLLKLIIDA